MLGITGQRVWANFHLTDPPKDTIMIEVTGQQFAWNIRYPGPDGVFGRTDVKLVDDAAGNPLGLDDKDPAARDDVVTQNQVAVPINRHVRIILKSKDVTHNFFVPQARMKQDAVPGLATFMQFTLNKAGKYEVACAELCGQLHWQMKAFVNVMSDQEYQNWLKERAP
jgi:cytochrome c oxidase subunit 2